MTHAGLERTFAFAYKLHDALVMAHVSKTPEPEPERAAGAPPPPPAPAFADGWELFEPKREYARLGFLPQDGSGPSDWRLWNDAYATAETRVRRRPFSRAVASSPAGDRRASPRATLARPRRSRPGAGTRAPSSCPRASATTT